jgi:hypothetical protein
MSVLFVRRISFRSRYDKVGESTVDIDSKKKRISIEVV